MVEISKEQYEYIKSHYKDAYITVCSKRKRGSKGNRKSGKTYYCPEIKEYMNAIKQLESGE